MTKDNATSIKWYEANTGNHQGLICDEKNGDNIAVTYKKENARLIVQAVNCHDEVKETLQACLDRLTEMGYSIHEVGLPQTISQLLSKMEDK